MKPGKYVAAGVALSIIIGINWMLSEDSRPLKSAPEKTLRIASANIDFRNDQPEALRQRLQELDADVLVLLEWIPRTVPENSLSGMKTVLAQVGRKHGISVQISERLAHQSQCRIFYTRIPENQKCRLPMGFCRIRIGEKHLVFLGVHIPPPHLAECQAFTDTTLAELAGLIAAGKLNQPFEMAAPGEPVIILGDLNAHPLNPFIRQFEKIGLVNAVGRFAHGWNPTWPARLPFFPALHRIPFLPVFRIDHILVAEEFSIKRAWRFRIPGSDHWGVACDLVI